ncbi:GNAT family N-acetyltransferase [Pseudocolwellia agarivorans]|uniref:GNAT family N-acetyltransferase n=1 Tax=Pseudocolwellia agarivorans TaxID=1911682 RepID=UPI0009867C76|nr:GNAT family N-acetyltransferase [Pseudocolwellia agarivorans]
MTKNITSDHIHVTLEELAISVRPITADDEEIEAEFVRQLSLETKHERFFEGIKELSPNMLKTLCNIDYVNTMAYIATVQYKGKEKEIGVCRYNTGANLDEREMALTIADDVPYESVATLLINTLSDHARKNKVKRLFSIDLNSNNRMQKLANSLGMTTKKDPEDACQVIYTLSL